MATSPGTPSSRAPSAGTTGRGFTEDEIYIGFGTYKAFEQTLGAFGFAYSLGDQEANARAIADDLNRRGGMAGRSVVPVFYDFTPQQQLQDRQGGAQAACVRWTEDQPVFAVVNHVTIGEPTLAACLAQRQTPLLANSDERPRSMYDRHAPYLFAPSGASLERLAFRWMERAKAIGYFEGWNAVIGGPAAGQAKVGIVSNNVNGNAEVFTEIMTKELARQGQASVETFEWSSPSQASAAVLRFRNAGVTHVVTSGLGTIVWFAQAAESQRYRPRYAMTTFHIPNGLPANVPRGQLAGALGVGWKPTTDVAAAQDPGDVSESQTRCRAVMEEAGQDMSNHGALGQAVSACDAFNFLAAAVERVGLSPQGVQAWAARVGSIQPASTFAISFQGGRPDGASAVRDLGYEEDCNCFTYLSQTDHAM